MDAGTGQRVHALRQELELALPVQTQEHRLALPLEADLARRGGSDGGCAATPDDAEQPLALPQPVERRPIGRRRRRWFAKREPEQCVQRCGVE